jgi:hypothetical protein
LSMWALTSIDPVKVRKVEISPVLNQTDSHNHHQRKLGHAVSPRAQHVNSTRKEHGSTDKSAPPTNFAQHQTESKPSHRQLSQNETMIQSTNGFLVHLPRSNEYLGIGQVHRSNREDGPNGFERADHYYFTHFFFTILDRPPHVLTSLSFELLFPAAAPVDVNGGRNKFDAETIQLWSGLEVVDSDDKDKEPLVVIAFGIHDSEAAITTMPWTTVEAMLQPLDASKDDGGAKQIGDFLMQLR